MLLLCLLGVPAGAETIVDIARFGDKKLGLLRRFRPFEAGTPSRDHLAIFWPAWMPNASSAALWTGSRR